MAVLFWFGLAAAQWKTGGRWGLGIGILALVTLAIQSLLIFIAIRSGRVPSNAIVLAKFSALSVLPLLVEATSSFALYATRDR
jgi:hypothetical protein